MHVEKIVAFHNALKSAGIEKFNLVKVTSILPPGCEIVEKGNAIFSLSPGSIVHCVMIEDYCRKGEKSAIALSVAYLKESDKVGCVAEYKAKSLKEAKERSSICAKEMLKAIYEGIDEKDIMEKTEGIEIEGVDTWVCGVVALVFAP